MTDQELLLEIEKRLEQLRIKKDNAIRQKDSDEAARLNAFVDKVEDAKRTIAELMKLTQS